MFDINSYEYRTGISRQDVATAARFLPVVTTKAMTFMRKKMQEATSLNQMHLHLKW
jgi:hypothetical protein